MAVRRGLFVQPTAGGVGTTPVDARINLAGLLTGDGALGVVPGVLSGLTVTGVASGWTYQVSAGHAVTTRGATDGGMLLSVDGNTNTPAPVLADGSPGSTSAPVSGSRYELIWILQRDIDAAEADNIAAIGVTQGVASGSPVRPAVPNGALVLAESLVPTGAANTAAGTVTITSVAPKVSVRGGVIDVANETQRNLLTTYATATNHVTVFRLDQGITETNYGAGWFGSSIGPWTTYTATLSAASGSFGVGTGGTQSTVYRREGDLVRVRYTFIYGTAAAVPVDGPRFTLPFTAVAPTHSFQVYAGVGSVWHPGAVYVSHIATVSSAVVQILLGVSPLGSPGIGTTAPFGTTWAVGDVLQGEFTYRAA